MKHLLLTTTAAVLVVGCGGPSAPDISIHDAAEKGNIEAVKQHLAAGADVNKRNDYFATPLHDAAAHGHKEIVELLIAKGAGVNAMDHKDGTPLLGAVENGQKEIIQLLIANGADVNAKNSVDGEAPLDRAIQTEHFTIAKLLRKHGGKYSSIKNAILGEDIEAVKNFLVAGADLNAKDDIGMTPLHFAVGNGLKEIVELLIANGADVNAKLEIEMTKNKALVGIAPLDDFTPLDRVTVSDDFTPITPEKIEMAELLRKHGAKHGTIYGAAAGGDIEAVKVFLANGIDVNAKAYYGESPLVHAVRGGSREVVELLISEGADVNTETAFGISTPLDIAIKNKHRKIADLLREHGSKSGGTDSIISAVEAGNIDEVKRHLAIGADVELRCKKCRGTALVHAAQEGHIGIAELLIEKGSDVNAKNKGGMTPLHNAARWSHKKIVELLIDKGADINATTSTYDETPLDWAMMGREKSIASLIRKHGGKSGIYYSIFLAASKGNIEAVKQHLAVGADVNAKNRYGSTPLHRAAYAGHKEIAELLIAEGADVNAKDEDGETPLDWAIEKNHTETADLLRKHGGKTGEELKAEGK